MSDYTQAIKDRALALNGTAVVVNLVGGQSLSGTLAYATAQSYFGTTYPDVATVTVTGKAHTVRLDHVSSIGQG
ncbi:hypothetical protein ACWER6_20760 [Streptomyces sp. NPDC004009]